MAQLTSLELIDVSRTEQPVGPRLAPRGVPVELQQHRVLTSTDPAVAGEYLGAFFGRTHVDAKADEFGLSVHAVVMDGLALAHIQFSGAGSMDVPVVGEVYTVHMPTTGLREMTVDGTRTELYGTTAIVSSPGRHLSIVANPDHAQLVVRIERRHVESAVSAMLGRTLTEPIIFDPVLELTSSRAIRWNIAMQLFSTELLAEDSLLRQGVGQAEIERLLISSLVLLQPSNYSERIRGGERRGTVQRLAEHVEQHLGEPLSTSSMAAALRVSTRTLQQALHDGLGMTPTEYVRERRLVRAHQDLVDADPGEGATVTSVAQRWGFPHPGSFAVQYRQRFGESPSQTLRGR